MATSDFIVENHAVLFLVKPQSPAALQHLRSVVVFDASWYEDALVVQPRYIALLLMELRDGGWRV